MNSEVIHRKETWEVEMGGDGSGPRGPRPDIGIPLAEGIGYELCLVAMAERGRRFHVPLPKIRDVPFHLQISPLGFGGEPDLELEEVFAEWFHSKERKQRAAHAYYVQHRERLRAVQRAYEKRPEVVERNRLRARLQKWAKRRAVAELLEVGIRARDEYL